MGHASSPLRHSTGSQAFHLGTSADGKWMGLRSPRILPPFPKRSYHDMINLQNPSNLTQLLPSNNKSQVTFSFPGYNKNINKNPIHQETGQPHGTMIGLTIQDHHHTSTLAIAQKRRKILFLFFFLLTVSSE